MTAEFEPVEPTPEQTLEEELRETATDNALDEAIPDRFGLETAEAEAASVAQAELESGREAGEADILAKAKGRLLREMDTMPIKDVQAIYLATARLEEARLLVAARKKGAAPIGSDELRKKAGRAIRLGGRGAIDDH